MTFSNSLISIIVACYNEQESIALFYKELLKIQQTYKLNIEIVLIDDGSLDLTWTEIKKIRSIHPKTQCIKFSRNFGKEAAIMAGLKHCKGNAAVIIDVDLQDPIELIPQFISKWQMGYDMVVGKRINRPFDSLMKKQFAFWFYKIFNQISDIKIPENVSDFRLISRKIIEEIIKLPEKNLFMKGIFSWVGFKTYSINFVRKNRVKGHSQFSFKKLYKLAFLGILSFSSLPLRIWSYLGTMSSISSFILLITLSIKYTLLNHTINKHLITVAVICFFGSIQLLSIGIVGQYLAQLCQENKKRPSFVIENHHSYLQKHTVLHD